MKKIKIVTDSTCDLPEEMVKDTSLEIVPLKVLFGDDEYLDRFEIGSLDFFEMLEKRDDFPQTAQPAVGTFTQLYEELGKEADSIISIHLSSKLSGTYEAASMAAEMVEDVKVTVIDSQLASFALGFCVMRGLDVAERTGDHDQVLEAIHSFMDSVRVFFTVDTLEYLQKGGRIGKAQAILGSILNVKPILKLEEGEVRPLDKVRGRKKLFARQVELVDEYRHEGLDEYKVAIAHGNSLGEAQKLAREIEKEYGVERPLISEIGPVIGTHTGPGIMGIFVYQ